MNDLSTPPLVPAAAEPRLAGEASADVAIVGGGLVGLALAYLIGSRRRVVLLEATRIARPRFGRTTATSMQGAIYGRLVREHGDDGAHAFSQAHETAIDWLAGIAGPGTGCQRAEAHRVATCEREAAALRDEAAAAVGLGLPARFHRPRGLAFARHGVLTFADQAEIDAGILHSRLHAQVRRRAVIHERSHVTSIEPGEPFIVRTDGGAVHARQVVVATGGAAMPAGCPSVRVRRVAHPVVAARLHSVPAPAGMWTSAGGPVRAFRAMRLFGDDWLVASGDAVAPGPPGARGRAFDRPARWIEATFGLRPRLRWTGEAVMPEDGLPLVGAPDRARPGLLVATGLGRSGITSGIVAAQILADLIEGRPHPLAAMLDPARRRRSGAAADLLAGLAGAGRRILRGRRADLPGPGVGCGAAAGSGPQAAAASGPARQDGAPREIAPGQVAPHPAAAAPICLWCGRPLAGSDAGRPAACPCRDARQAGGVPAVAGPPARPARVLERSDTEADPV